MTNATNAASPPIRRQHEGGREAETRSLDQPVADADQREHNQRVPDHVNPPALLHVTRLGHVPQRQVRHSDGDGQVDQEYESPGVCGDQDPTEKGRNGAGDATQPRPGADRAGAVFPDEGGFEDRKTPRRQQCAADPLHGTRGDEQGDGGRDGAQQRGDRKPDDADGEDAATSKPVAECAAEK